MRQTLTDDFWGLHKNMNCAFPLMKNEIFCFVYMRLFAIYPLISRGGDIFQSCSWKGAIEERLNILRITSTVKFQVPFYLSFSISCRYASQFLLILQLPEICAAALSGKIFFLFPSSKLNSTWRTSNMKKFSSLTVFKKHLLKEIRPVPHSVYKFAILMAWLCCPNGLNLLS